MKAVEQLYERQELVTGVPTGFTDLDKKTAGLQPGDLVIVAGRPSMGKTAFALNIAQYAALEAKTGVAVFSLEMSKEQLVFRMLCSEARVDQSKVRAGYAAQRDYPKLAHRRRPALRGGDLHRRHAGAVGARAARQGAPAQARARGQPRPDHRRLPAAHARDDRATAASRRSPASRARSRRWPRSSSVPVMALSQLNRQVESRGDKRPVMADLRESGAIEQDADVIMFLYRPVVYDPKNADERDAEMIIGKQRNGPTGTVPLTFFSEYTRFENRAADEVSFEAEIDEL